MEALGGGGNWGFWGRRGNWEPMKKKPSHRSRNHRAANSSGSVAGGAWYRFPLKQAITAGSLALTGDTIAQFSERWRKNKNKDHKNDMDLMMSLLSGHDWLRALRMSSYGFLLYGPGSYAWYQYLDLCLPKQTVENLVLKVLLSQIVVGPSVIAVVFAWNSLWQGKLSQLPGKYQKDALPTLFYGEDVFEDSSSFLCTEPFGVVPLEGRVAFMSMGSIFWNFCLSSTISK